MENSSEHVQHAPWNKGVIVGQKSPFKLKDIWAIRVRLQLQHRVHELAMFDLVGLDSKLRACDLVKMRVRDICHGEHVAPRATVMQKNLAASSVRDNAPNPRCCQRVDQGGQTWAGRLLVPQPHS